jgi:alpha-beta hydrolase superfamily lysophospholipase
MPVSPAAPLLACCPWIVRAILALPAYAAIFCSLFRWSDCNSLPLLFGGAAVLWLDRQVFGLVPVPANPWKKELMTRLGYFTIGAVAPRLALGPSLPWSEAAFLGFVVTAGTSGVDGVAALVQGLRGREVATVRAPISRWRIAVLAVGFVLVFILLVPLVNFHPVHFTPWYRPDQHGLAYDSVAFTTPDGLTIRGDLVAAKQPRGNVIFCHGHMANRSQVAGLMPTFHALRLNVLAFDFRGHGESDGRCGTFGQREVADLLAAKQFIQARHPGLPTCVVAISYGAAVTLQALPQMPDVAAVWLEAPFADFLAVADAKFRPLPAPVRAGLIDFYSVLARLDCGFRPEAVYALDRLAGVRVPLFLIQGEDDQIIPASEGRAIIARYEGPKEAWLVTGANHFNLFKTVEHAYPSRLREFLGRHVLP